MTAPTWTQHLKIAQPAAGGGFAFELDAQYEWAIRAVYFELTTGAGAPVRTPILAYQGPDAIPWCQFPLPAVQGTGHARWQYVLTVDEEGASTITLFGGGKRIHVPLPHLWLPGGWTLAVSIDGVQAADQLGNIRLYVWQRLSRPGALR